MNDVIRAWKKQTSKGEVISFTINGVKYSMWPNRYKKEVFDEYFKKALESKGALVVIDKEKGKIGQYRPLAKIWTGR